MKLYLYSLADLSIIEQMMIRNLKDAQEKGDQYKLVETSDRLRKVRQEIDRQISVVEFVAGDDPSETKEHVPVKHKISPESLAILFHDKYETLAPSYGYETREETRTFDPESKNGMLMIQVCREILNYFKMIGYEQTNKNC